MAIAAYRVLKRKGRVNLIETANPLIGVGYLVRNGNLEIWSGDSRREAEQRFKQSAEKLTESAHA